MEAAAGTTERGPGALLSRPGSCCLCGSTGGPLRVVEAGYAGRACECGTIYIDPTPAPTATSPTDDAHLDSYYALPASLRMAWAKRFVARGRFLEVGCGSGQLVGRALDEGFEVEAVEPNPACAAWVRQRYGIEVEESLIEDSALPADRFDLIFHVDLLSHFPDPIRALTAMAERLRPGGYMCFEVGLFAGLDPRWYPWVGRPRFPAHRWFYDETALAEVLTRGGFELVDVKSFAIAPSTVISALLRRLLPSRLEAVPEGPTETSGLPARGNVIQRAYARVHYLLRYRLGALIPVPGPRTAFVAARRQDRSGS